MEHLDANICPKSIVCPVLKDNEEQLYTIHLVECANFLFRYRFSPFHYICHVTTKRILLIPNILPPWAKTISKSVLFTIKSEDDLDSEIGYEFFLIKEKLNHTNRATIEFKKSDFSDFYSIKKRFSPMMTKFVFSDDVQEKIGRSEIVFCVISSKLFSKHVKRKKIRIEIDMSRRIFPELLNEWLNQ